MRNAIEFDITDTLDKFNKLHKSMEFIISKSLNDIAFSKGRKELSDQMDKDLEIRNKRFASYKTIRVNKSNKRNLEVTLYHVKEDLGLQQFGGTEKAKSKKLAIPVRKTFKNYMGIANGRSIPPKLRIPNIMKNAPFRPRRNNETNFKHKGHNIFILNSGVFIRVNDGVDGLRPLYIFKDQAKHNNKQLKFQERTLKVYEKNFERYFKRNFLKQLRG